MHIALAHQLTQEGAPLGCSFALEFMTFDVQSKS